MKRYFNIQNNLINLVLTVHKFKYPVIVFFND